ncbi:hypothetical protein ACFXJ5_12935 [Streptomyces sp. NPDC059373]
MRGGTVGRSAGLGDARGYVTVDTRTFQSTARPNVFAIGDATGTPVSTDGSAVHLEGDVLVNNIRRFLAGRSLDGSFDGHARCFVETSRLNHLANPASRWPYWNTVLPGRDMPGIGSALPWRGRTRRHDPAGTQR